MCGAETSKNCYFKNNYMSSAQRAGVPAPQVLQMPRKQGCPPLRSSGCLGSRGTRTPKLFLNINFLETKRGQE